MIKTDNQLDQAVSFTFCKSFAQAETKSVEWPIFVASVTRSVEYENKQASIARAAIVGGVRDDEQRGRADNVRTRTILTLDYDDLPGVTLADIEVALLMALDCAWVAYSTYRHTPDTPRVRVFVPLSRPVGKAEYEALVDRIADDLGLGAPDSCSKVMAQIFFLASHQADVEPWSASEAGSFLDVDAMGLDVVEAETDDGLDLDLEIAVAAQPLDLTDEAIGAILEAYPSTGLDHGAWLDVGMALSHQCCGRADGFNRWREWSEKDPQYQDDWADEKTLGVLRTRYKSMRGNRVKPLTFATIIKRVKDAGGSVELAPKGEASTALDDEAATVSDAVSWSAFKTRVQGLNENAMPPDRRAMLASIVHARWGKGAGLSLSEVKKALKRPRGAIGEGLIDTPEWLSDWIYAEADCLFINRSVADYGIRREAFRAKHDREAEVRGRETDAATFALTMAQIPTVVRPMYWPGQPKMFETEGKTYVNSYHDSGIPPADTIDDDGQGVVDLFLAHVDNTIGEPREREILLDFISYIYRHPGKRVRWGLLLWGIEGNGKTYFWKLMQLLLGQNATLVSTSMIERPFTDWAVGSRLIGIEEVRIAGTNKWRILDQLKPMISNDTIAVEPKGLSRYHAPNFASYLLTTNHHDAVPVSDNDRRYCIIFTCQRDQDDLFEQHGGVEATGIYFTKLFAETERRADAIGRFLLDRPISGEFEPSGRAPITAGLAEMRGANVSDDRQVIDDALEDYASPIVNKHVLDITYLNKQALMDGVDMPTSRALSNVLRDLGMRPVDQKRVKIRGVVHFVWFRPSGARTSDDAVEAVRVWHAADKDFKEPPF